MTESDTSLNLPSFTWHLSSRLDQCICLLVDIINLKANSKHSLMRVVVEYSNETPWCEHTRLYTHLASCRAANKLQDRVLLFSHAIFRRKLTVHSLPSDLKKIIPLLILQGLHSLFHILGCFSLLTSQHLALSSGIHCQISSVHPSIHRLSHPFF